MTLIDWSVWVAGRLIFNAEPDVGRAPNHRVLDANVKIVNRDGGVLDIDWIEPPQPPALEDFEAATGAVLEFDPAGRGAARESGATTLLTEVEARGEVKRLGDWLAWMLDNDTMKLRCQAPFRASVSEAAFIRVDENGDAFIHDLGTSTNYPLGPLPQMAEPVAKTAAETMSSTVIDALQRRAQRQAKTAPAAISNRTGWRKPDPLPDGLLPVEPFAMAFLPASLAPWVADIADLMQCPPDYVAIPAMVSLSATIGRKIAIRPQRNTDWSEVANLWGLIIGPAGVMKSPSMAEATKPLRRLEMEARKNKETATKAYEFALEDHKLRAEAAQKRFKEALKKDPNASSPAPLLEPVEPKARRYIVDDATYEKLGDILVNNPNGALAYRDELMSLLRTLDREEYAAARGFFLAAWGGKESYTFDRIIRGTQHIEAACLSLLGASQPNKSGRIRQTIDDDGQGDDGMLQRFGLAVWPDIGAWREVDRYPDSAAKQSAFEVFQRLNELDPYAIGAVQDPFDPVPYLKFDREAQEVFSAWHRHLEIAILRGDEELSPALKGHFSKYRKLVPALALINHLADGVAAATSAGTRSSGPSLLAAISKPTPAVSTPPARKTRSPSPGRSWRGSNAATSRTVSPPATSIGAAGLTWRTSIASRPHSTCWSIWNGSRTSRSSVQVADGRLSPTSSIRSGEREADPMPAFAGRRRREGFDGFVSYPPRRVFEKRGPDLRARIYNSNLIYLYFL